MLILNDLKTADRLVHSNRFSFIETAGVFEAQVSYHTDRAKTLAKHQNHRYKVALAFLAR